MNSAPLVSQLPLHRDFDASYLEYWGILPVEITQAGLLVLAVSDPDEFIVRDLEESYQVPVEVRRIDRDDLLEGIRRTFAAAQSMDDLVRDLGDTDEGPHARPTGSDTDVRDLANQPPVVRFVNLLVREAHDARASDVHLESTAGGLDVRFRIDGVLTSAPSPPASLQAAVVSRVKLVADLDIAERRAPQDGRVRVRLEERELDLRVSTMPTLHGESVVIRLLDHGGGPTRLDDLGMDEGVLRRFRSLAERPHGILIATGPTGSGKTTTLYSALRLRDALREKIITVEDPVEYQLSHITQVPVNRKAGMTFATSLRSILRQDPDVVMVGEMRDGETASIAVQAAMTGHLVLSTLHTNDAVGAVSRLTDLGVEGYLLSATLEGILAQRLVRRVCGECKEEYEPDGASIGTVADHHLEGARLTRGRGCSRCRGTGYYGRIGLFELVTMTESVRRLAGDPDRLDELRQVARDQGMHTLREDGWRKVRAGITTVEEVSRAIQS